MTVHFIGAGPGAADLITVRGRDLIARCPVCLYAGSLVPPALLAHCPPGARIVDTAPMSLDEIVGECTTATGCRPLSHGTSARAKLWPEHQWVKLADHVHHRGLLPVLLWGNEEERLRSERIAKPLSAARVAPRLSLHAIASLLGYADAVFGVDTGLSHLAVALGRPTVGIYCATDPAATGLYGSTHAANVSVTPPRPPSLTCDGSDPAAGSPAAS